MENCYGWMVDLNVIFIVYGLVNGIVFCIDIYIQLGDGVIVFIFVYYVFYCVICVVDCELVECQMVNKNGWYELDFDVYDVQMIGNEKMVILCLLYNLFGCVWIKVEFEQVVDFVKWYDLIIVLDEIYYDLIMLGQKYILMILIDGIEDWLIMMIVMIKIFNIVGMYLGNVIIFDMLFRFKFVVRMQVLGILLNFFGLFMVIVVYSLEGVEWFDVLRDYINENCKIFDEGINVIFGLKLMEFELIYLVWVDFFGIGMLWQEFIDCVVKQVKIVVNVGLIFGFGGEDFLCFNIVIQCFVVEDVVECMKVVFGDFQ